MFTFATVKQIKEMNRKRWSNSPRSTLQTKAGEVQSVGLERGLLSYDDEQKFLYIKVVLKSFFLTILLLVVSTLLMIEVAISVPLPQGTQALAAETQASEAVDASKAERPDRESTPEGKRVDPNQMREPAPISPSDHPRAAYDMDAIKAFDDELFGP